VVEAFVGLAVLAQLRCRAERELLESFEGFYLNAEAIILP
jgi:hypothetical protein